MDNRGFNYRFEEVSRILKTVKMENKQKKIVRKETQVAGYRILFITFVSQIEAIFSR